MPAKEAAWEASIDRTYKVVDRILAARALTLRGVLFKIEVHDAHCEYDPDRDAALINSVREDLKAFPAAA